MARVISAFGTAWTSDDNLLEICDQLDQQQVPPPKTWLTRQDGVARSWSRGRQHYPHLVIKAIKDRLKAFEIARERELKLSRKPATSAKSPLGAQRKIIFPS